MLEPPDMCLITSRNVKQTSTLTKTAKPSTNYNEPSSICLLLRKASVGPRDKNRMDTSGWQESRALPRGWSAVSTQQTHGVFRHSTVSEPSPAGRGSSPGVNTWAQASHMINTEKVTPGSPDSTMRVSLPCLLLQGRVPLTQTLPTQGFPLPSTLPSSVFTLSVKCSPTWKNNPPGSCKMCPHTFFSFLLERELKNQFHWSIIRWKLKSASVLQASSEIPTLWRKHQQKHDSPSQEEAGERGQIRRTLWSRSRAAPKPQARTRSSWLCWAASSTAQSGLTCKRTRRVLRTILIIRAKSQKRGGGEEEKSTILLLFDDGTLQKN